MFVVMIYRSLSHDDPKIEGGVENSSSGAGGEINFRRSQSNDNFQTKNAPPGEFGTTTTVNDIESVRNPAFCLSSCSRPPTVVGVAVAVV